MLKNIQEFNPTIYYAFDAWNQPLNETAKHHHDFFEISILLEGEGYYLIDGHWQSISSGKILLFNPGVEHGEKQLPNTYSHQLHIGIGDFQLENLPKNNFPDSEIILTNQKNQIKIFDKAWQLINEFNQQHSNFNLICKGLVLEIMGLLLQGLADNTNENPTRTDRLNQAVQLIITYMENNFAKDLTIEQLATTHFVSPTYLSRIFKEVTGVSPITYLIQIRLKEAYKLLEQNQITIKEVAKAVGYEDAYHFSKSFKKFYGFAPSKLQKNRGA